MDHQQRVQTYSMHELTIRRPSATDHLQQCAAMSSSCKLFSATEAPLLHRLIKASLQRLRRSSGPLRCYVLRPGVQNDGRRDE
jgi:hypothetical protein